ncbi:golgin subfamily A member 1 isoform X2 [Terrapene carolina triunguis]|uniref:golgin subfamily A member 1 isoform X2 n=1 Tax=Terrapene triunguis TaxID=2587831 RepID=UPI00115617D9|nr:golgin subfamily A member 1 isoform X2 [Terrapene carolina triunguis]
MFAKLKKKIAEEAAIAPRPGGAARIPRSVSKESITSVGADSGDDFASDGSSSREDLSSQLLRRNEQIRKLEAKLSDYAEQVRNLQKIKEKLEIALEKHQDSSMKKFQEQNEAYQANRAKMAEGMALALEKKDQEKEMLSAQLQEMREQSLNLFQKRDEIDELEGFQQQELAKVKHMEESLSRAEQELEACSRELTHAKKELQVTSNLSSLLSSEVEELRQQHSELEAQRDELVAAEANAENKITALEQRGQELQTFIQHLSADLQNARVAASGCEKRLETLQMEHESLKLEYEQHKLKMTVEVDEKNKLIEHLQEKVSSLEKRLEGNFSGDEHVWELLKEKTALEQKLDDTRQQLLTARTNHAETVNLLETQVTKLNSKVTEAQGLLCERDEFLKNFKESNMCQLKELEQALQLANGALERSKEEIGERDLQIQKLQTDLEVESSKLQQHISTVKHQCAERISRLEAQIAALETAREFDKTTSQHKISQLEQENEDLNESRQEYESSLKKQESELERLKKELSSRETVSVEIAKALEETRKQREELQQQVTDLILLIKEKDQLINEKTDVILKKEEELNQLSQGHEALVLQMHLLQSDIEACKSQAAEREETAGKQISALRLKMQEQQEQLLASERNVLALEAARAFNKHLYPPEDSEVEQNGEVAAADILQLQKDNRDLEQQISEKNKMIKQLQQRMAELKKTLQKELKIRPDNEIPEVREKPNSEVPNAAMTVTNNSDLNDSREINFEYLKHVVLKFMSCREAEAFHLIKAVSVLLNFSQEEENMLKETLEYKMSWFGSKPSPKGSIRPSISNPRTAWS